MNLISEVDKPVVNRTIVVYSGRFQPFHRGHYAAYQSLVSKFGNNNVYIASSDVTDSSKSPLRFKEKKEIATKMFGIPSNRFVKVSNPYAPEEILSKYDGKTTQYIAAVGEKDAQRLQGKYFKPYKGKAGYGYEEIGYVYLVPAQKDAISGTEVRKGLSNKDKEKAKKFFLKAYPKFDKDVFNMITSKLNEYGTLRGKGQAGSFNNYKADIKKEKDETVNTKPSSKMRTEPHPTRYETEHPSDEPDWYKRKEPYTEPQNELYDPISQIIKNLVTEDDFEEFASEYFEEKRDDPRKLGLVHLGYGLYGKKKGDEPTHKRDKTGKIVPLSDKEKGTSQALAKSKPPKAGQPVKRGQTPQGKIDKLSPTGIGTLATKSPQQKIDKLNPAVSNQKKDIKQSSAGEQPEQPQKLPSKDFVSSAEKGDDNTSEKEQKIQTALKTEREGLSKEENQMVDNVNNPDSKERKGFWNSVKKGLSKAGKALGHWAQHKGEMISGTVSAVKDLATTGKLGSVKDKEGKNRHYSEFQKKDESGKPVFDETPVYDKDGTIKKFQKKPALRDDISDEERNLAEQSWNKREKQKKDCKHFAIDVGILAGSMVAGGAVGAGVKAIIAGKGLGAAGSAALHGANIFGHGVGGFGAHLGKDIAKHAAFETLGAGAAEAGAGGVGLAAVTGGLLEMLNEQKIDNNKFIVNFFKRFMEKFKGYKLSDEQLLQSIKDYKKNKPKQDAADLLKEEIDIKQNNINDFVKYATQKLKLKETPKITLIDDKTFGEQKHSLGGYNPDSKEIFVQSEGRLSADIIRTIAHEMVHRKQDELGLIKNPDIDGATGSPIENQANAVAGILLRNYGKRNKAIYTETIKKVGNKFVVYPKAGGKRLGTHSSLASAKKQLAAIEINKEDISVDVEPGDEILMGKFKNKKVKVKDISKDDHGMPTINGRQATTFRTLNEVSALSGGDDQPNGAWLPKNTIRELGANNGINKSDDWFTNGGYTQIDFPIADQIMGDDDETEIYIKYKTKNIPRTDFEKTKFNKGEDKISLSEYQKLAQEVLRDLYTQKQQNTILKEDAWKSVIDAIAEIISAGLTPLLVSAAVGVVALFTNSIRGIVYDIKHLINPDEIDKFTKIINKNKSFNIEVIKLLSDKGGLRKFGAPITLSKAIMKLPSFQKLWNDFAKENKLDEAKQRAIVHEMEVAIANSFKYNGNKIIKRLKSEYPDIVKDKKIDESKLLMEGGAYGHMSHPFDDMDLTFGDLKNIIKGALEGDLGVVREKTDGQALAISWKNGRLIAARNKGHLANAGANAMGIEGVASKFGGRGDLSDAYNFAMNDLNAAISSLSEKQRKKIFNEGKCFMNLEVIWPQNSNVIPYGQALLIFHNTSCYDESGTAIGADQSAARTLAGMIKQVNADVQSKYTIQGPPVTELPKNQKLNLKQGQYLSKLNKLKSEFGCSDSDTLAVYHQHWWENFVNKSGVKLQKLEKEALIRRWAFGDKSFRLNTISDKKAQEWAIQNDKVNVIKQQKDNMKPFEEIFLGVGADVLQFMSSVLTVHPEKALRSMKDEFKTVANQVRSANNPALIDKLKDEMKRLNALGGIKSIVPIEGIVFFYNGKTYKLTGSFAALNQILGLLKFSR